MVVQVVEKACVAFFEVFKRYLRSHRLPVFCVKRFHVEYVLSENVNYLHGQIACTDL